MMKRTPLDCLLGLYQPSWKQRKDISMKTGQLILEAMQSVLDELKTSDSRRESHRALTLIKLSEAYEAYSTVIALEDA